MDSVTNGMRMNPGVPSTSLAVVPFSPKGWDVTAQGNALGDVVDVEFLSRTVFVQALKGRHGAGHAQSPARIPVDRGHGAPFEERPAPD